MSNWSGTARRSAPAAAELTGRTPVLLSGDNVRVARHLAAQVGITDVRAGLLPEGKVAAVRAGEAEGRKVLVVGDGVNDAPALPPPAQASRWARPAPISPWKPTPSSSATTTTIPTVAHAAQLRKRRQAVGGAATVRVADGLDACERADVTVVQPSSAGRKAVGRPLGLGLVNDPDATADLAAWVENGGPGATEPPAILDIHALSPSRRVRAELHDEQTPPADARTPSHRPGEPVPFRSIPYRARAPRNLSVSASGKERTP